MDEGVSCLRIWSIPCLDGALSAGRLYMARVFLRHLPHRLVKVVAGLSSLLNQVVFFDNLILLCSEVSPYWVSHPGVEVAIRSDHGVLWTMIDSARDHLLSESNEVRRAGQVPMLMGPHLARHSHPSLDLINDHIYPKLCAERSQLVRVLATNMYISTL